VRTCSRLLEILDPLKHNAKQEFGDVVLMLSYDESTQERLDTLTGEARRLKHAVVETRCGHSTGGDPHPKSRRLAAPPPRRCPLAW
jgi:hypothetical protein